MNKKLTYFINGFSFQYNFLKKQLGEKFYFILKYPNIGKYTPGWKYIPLNFFLLRKLYKKGEIQKYNIVHFNNTENFLNFKKQKNQISIAESHGFDFGVNYNGFIKGEKNKFKKYILLFINKIIGWKIRQKINEFDIYYCSTPDMLEPLKKIREDVKWLPNPIDTNIFKPDGKIIKLEGNPACFFPTRLHHDKKPEIAINIFQNYIKKKFPNATLHLLNQGSDLEKYKKRLNDNKTYFWHDFMDKETLAGKIRGADLCFGDFDIGALSLMPMQIMACKKSIITYDKYEIIKLELNVLLDLTKKIFEDKNFKNNFIEKNYNYILKYHSEEGIAKIHFKKLKPLLKEKFNIKL